VNGMQTFTQQEYAHVAARIDALMPWDLAWGSTVAILIARGTSLHVFGSGTLLRIADESLLVTASHVIEKAGAQNLCIIRAGQTRKDDIVPLEAEAILSDSDGLDVAVLRLNPSVVADFANKDFLRLDRVCRDKEDLSEAMFAVIGFPEIMSGIENGILKFTKFHHIAPAYEGDGFALDGFYPSVHFLVDADPSETRTNDGKPMEFRSRSGDAADFPRQLGGISGGSVWKLADGPKGLAKRAPGSARMVGVEIGIFSDTTCMLASRWSSVIGMLRNALPELCGPIDLWRGE
jgi:hypothetical protein